MTVRIHKFLLPATPLPIRKLWAKDCIAYHANADTDTGIAGRTRNNV